MRKIFLLLLFTFTTLFASQMAVVHGLNPNGDGFLSLRVKPKSTEIGKLYNGDVVEILDRNGKYYEVKDIKSDKIGWAHSNWIKSTSNANFLLADIDNDGKKERLQWYEVPLNDYEWYNQLILFDDNDDLLWKGNNSIDTSWGEGGESVEPVIFDDIDGDGNAELLISSPPHEAYSPGAKIYRWTGKKFTRTTKTKYLDLVWIDAPNGNTLQWTEITQKDYQKRKKIWWVAEFSQMPNNELPIVEIAGVQYPDFRLFQRSKAKIRFTPTGAVIEEWITTEEHIRSGIDIYESECAVCHATDGMGAPVVGDKAAWIAVLGKGIDQVYHNAINGKGGMPPKGGAMDLTDAELKKAVDYMIEASK